MSEAPLGVKLISVWHGFVGILALLIAVAIPLGVLASLMASMPSLSPVIAILLAIVLGVIGVFELVVAKGLWDLESWAFWAAIILSILGFFTDQ